MHRYLGQETQIILQSTTMPGKVLEVILSTVDTILDWDIPTQVPKFIQNRLEDTTIVHAGSAFDMGAIGTWSDDLNFSNRTEFYFGFQTRIIHPHYYSVMNTSTSLSSTRPPTC